MNPMKWWTARRQRPDPFVDQLLLQTEQLCLGSEAVVEFMMTPTKEQALRVRDIERAADRARRQLIVQIKAAFVTPFDREDLFSLSRALDDVLDYLYSTTREIFLLNVAPNPHLKAMATILSECTHELDQAIQALRQEPDLANRHAVRVLALENRMDRLYVAALADLFENVSTKADVVRVLKLREIYRHMIHAAQSAEQAANAINDILVKFH
jgi:predicted phosphate transport protein (TIGR00153 family)